MTEARARTHALGPLRRCTPPGTRETTLRRPVSWLATGRGLRRLRRSRLLAPRRNGVRDRSRRLQLRGQPRPGGAWHHVARSRFSPFGPPAHGATL